VTVLTGVYWPFTGLQAEELHCQSHVTCLWQFQLLQLSRFYLYNFQHLI